MDFYHSGHTHQWGGYSRSKGEYYEGGHGENISKESKREAEESFKRQII